MRDNSGIIFQWFQYISMDNASLKKRDLAVLWHPCSQMKDYERYPMTPIKRGDGVYLEDYDGNRYIDAVSSWWVNLFGHSNPIIANAMKEQVDKLEHVIFAGFTHEPAIDLAEQLVALTPEGLDRVFYGENGSSAVEIALKMSLHYWQLSGKPEKTQFIALESGYHGETTGALAVSDLGLYKAPYKPLMFDVMTAPSPDCFFREEGESWHDYSLRQFEKMRELVEREHKNVAAIIVEPLVQCASGMRMYHPVYLSELRKLCDEFDVHLIADEIAVGFGRTGTLFACEQADISPDFMCVSKGLTAGFLPLSAMLTRESIFQAFYDDYEKLTAFLHSHSYTGYATGCAVAKATLDIFQSEPVIENNKVLAQHMAQATAHFADHPNVAEVRQTGMILAAEMVQDKASRTPYDWKERRGMRVYEHALSHGALLRPLGNIVYFMPPYVITPEEIDKLADIAWQGIQLATKD